MSEPFDWKPYLERGERLQWQGRKQPGGPLFRGMDWLIPGIGAGFAVGGLVFLGITLTVMRGAGAGMELAFGAFAALFILVGLGMVGFAVRGARLRAGASYALTDRRALVHDGTKIRVWTIAPGMEAMIQTGNPASIVLDREVVGYVNDRPAYRDLGFIDISDAQSVMRLLERQIDNARLRDASSSASASASASVATAATTSAGQP